MEKMSNIPEFYVTNRSFEQICSTIHLTLEDIQKLPQNAVIMELGSGVIQNFARKIKEIRPDIQVISIDPSLSIGSPSDSDYESKVIKDKNNEIDTAVYINKNLWSSFEPPKQAKITDLKELQDFRLKEAAQTGGVVSALAPDLPIRENSLDLIIDVYGPGLYIQINQEKEIEEYFREIYRVLKVNGEMRIYPAINMSLELRRNMDPESSREFSKNFFKEIFRKNKLNFEIEYLETQDPGIKDTMLVLILRKK